MMHFLSDWVYTLQGWLFQSLVEPLLYASGFGDIADDAYNGVEWFLWGMVELALLYLVLRPLEAWFPVQADLAPAARRNDFVYTCVRRLGVFGMMVFLVFGPLFDKLAFVLRMHGFSQFNLEALWPGVTDVPLVSFFCYLVVLDFVDYWYHRASHRFHWWWGLHSLHHSQRDMNLWSDDRNHLLDDLMRNGVLALIALAIGVEPGQFLLLVIASEMLQSLQHANVRLHFGMIGERLLVSPRYHRLHHAIGAGHESEGAGSLGGCNFAVLFPLWDILFGTADFSPAFRLTGVRDQLPPPQGIGRNYGSGYWSQQWLGIKRMVEFARKGSA